jgi:lysozyme
MRNLKPAVELIKKFEGLRLKAYKDPVGIWTIGFGITGAWVKAGTVITKEKALALLEDDLVKRSAALEKLLKVDVNDNQFCALLSFAYNCGIGLLKKSKLLEMVNDNVPDSVAAVHDMFGHYNHAGGKVLAGLTKRRAAEADLYCS